jgi:UDP-N-acetylmuramoylalanine--D-glutamate ligase
MMEPPVKGFDHGNSSVCQQRAELSLAEPVIVVGLGASGLSAIRFLRARGYAVSAADSQASPVALPALAAEFSDLAIELGPFSDSQFCAAGTLVLSPGVALTQPAVAAAISKGVEALGDIELFARVADAPIVAVTGSNGKSTVVTLLARMIASAGANALAGGNLGPPALALLEQPTPDMYVLELSSFQLETTSSLTTAVACLLNASPDHLDRYTSFDAYVAAKQRIFTGAELVVINRDDNRTTPTGPTVLSAEHRPNLPRAVSFGLDEPHGHDDFGVRLVQGKRWLAQGHTLLARCDALPLPGTHNLANALAALAIGNALGLSVVAMIGALLDFKGLTHRCELVGETGGLRWINDSKGTNVGATCAAIRGLSMQTETGATGTLILVAGGDGKGADFAPLGAACVENVSAVILFGRDADIIAASLPAAVETIRVQDLPAAVRSAAQIGKAGQVVLFSPACASFDMFRNYEERGREFTRLVQEIVLA